jgi:2-polyprenyl-3-methyl-5-hydroxy-6-metoxy-1,4-benzoquinol methylase
MVRRARQPVSEHVVSYPERIVPGEAEPGVDAVHLKRYDFAAPLCAARRVLDAGCGVGYGSARLAAAAASVVGVDLSEDAIGYAREHYAAANLSFAVMDVTALDFADASFDAICSFETIEHVEDAERGVVELARVLHDEGVLVVSTPQVERTTTTPANPYHRVEFARADFEALLGRHFVSVELYGQHRVQTRRHRIAQRLDVLGLRRRVAFLRRASVLLGTAPMANLTADDIVIERESIERASELVAVCRTPRRPS